MSNLPKAPSISPSLSNTAQPSASPPVWFVVGASRGIGLEFVRQLLANGNHVYAVIRNPASASNLWQLAAAGRGRCEMLECDIAEESSIIKLAQDVAARKDLDRIDYVVLNAGILNYPNRASELYDSWFVLVIASLTYPSSFNDFAALLRTNTIGPIITAQKLLDTGIPIRCLAFMSSDCGSASKFGYFEDGFAGYGASKAALNQSIRHLAAELQRKKVFTTVLAIHPGEVATDMAVSPSGCEIEGLLSPQESVSGMLQAIETKDIRHTGTFWTWEGKVFPW